MKKYFFIAAGLSLALVAAGIGSLSVVKSARSVNADGEVEIGTASELNTFLNGANQSKNAILTADIDMEGAVFSAGKLGGYSAVFDGDGHKIFNYTVSGANAALFNTMSGTIQNLTIDWTAGSKDCAGLVFMNDGGLIDNCTSIMHITDDAVCSVWGPAGFSKAPGSGTYTNLITNFAIDVDLSGLGADAGTYPSAIVCETDPDKGNTNKYFISGVYSATIGDKVRKNGASLLSHVTAISLDKNSITNLNPDDTDTVTLSMTGTEYNSVTWTSLDTNVATVSGNASGATITAVAGGTTTVKVEVESTNGNTYEASVSVSVNAAATDVSDISISNTNEIVYVGDTTNLSITFKEGTLYNSIVWSSSNPSAATVSGNGMSATVSAVAAGKATITVRVNTNSGYVERTCVFKVLANRFMPLDGYKQWGGAGLFLGVDASKLPNDYNSNFTATITSSAQGEGNFVNFQSHGGHTCAYVTFAKAASEISATFSISFAFVYKSTTTYSAELLFTGETYVAPTVTVSFTNDIVVGDTFDIGATSNYTVSEFEFASSDEAKVSLDNATNNSAEGSALVAGNSTIRATAIINGAEVYGEKVATVAATAADVSEIELNETSGLLKVGEHANLTVQFVTGRNYESITWVSNDTDVATVAANGVNCTVNALAAGSTTITVTVITESTPLGLTATYDLSVTADLYKDIYFAVPKDFLGLSGTYAAWIYNGGAEGEATAFVDTGIDVVYKEKESNLYVASINLDHAYDAFASANLYFQFCIMENTGARFGAGYHLGTEKANINSVVLGFNDSTTGATAINKIGNGDDMVAAIEFFEDNIKAIRDANSGSVCSANFTSVVAAHTALTDGQEALANIICDNTAQYDDVTVLDTINMMKDKLASGSIGFDFAPIATSENNVVIIVLVSALGLIAVLGATIYLRKRKAE